MPRSRHPPLRRSRGRFPQPLPFSPDPIRPRYRNRHPRLFHTAADADFARAKPTLAYDAGLGSTVISEPPTAMSPSSTGDTSPKSSALSTMTGVMSG